MDQPPETGPSENSPGAAKAKRAKESLKLAISAALGLALLLVIAAVAAPILIFRSPDQALYLAYAETWPVKFRDAFDAHSLAHWTPSDGAVNGGINRWNMQGGRFEVAFAPTQDHIVRDAFFNQRASAPRDFLLTLQVRPPFDCHTGIAFRGSAQGDYYVFLVGNDSYTTEILTRADGADLPREALVPNTPLPKGAESPDRLDVLAHDDRYYFYINRVFVDQMSDPRLRGDRTGIELFVCNGVSQESVFKIDGFSLRTPYWFSR